MFDLGLWELLIIFLIGLLILGPERMARTARIIGFWLGKARGAFNAAKSEVERELRVEDLRKAGESIRHEVEGVGRQVEESGRQMEKAGWDFEKEVADVRRRLQGGVENPLSADATTASADATSEATPDSASSTSSPTAGGGKSAPEKSETSKDDRADGEPGR